MEKSASRSRVGICLGLAVAILAISVKIGAADEIPDAVSLVRASAPRAALPGEARAWSVDLDLAVLGMRGPSRPKPVDPIWIRIDLASEEPLVLEVTERKPLARGGHGWVGRWADGVPGHAVLVVRNSKVYGSIKRPGLNLHVRPVEGADRNGTHRITEWDEEAWPDEPRDFEPVWAPPDLLAETSATPVAPGNPVIDVLVVYTPATRSGAGGTEAIEALIALAELETNTSYANSNVGQRIRVVHSQEVAYLESGSTSTDLGLLRGIGDGSLEEVHPLRDLYGADAVSLWIESGGCGRGYIMTTVSSGFASSAFNVVQRSCATGNLTFGHELGHNMSLRHDWYVDQGTSPYVYNHGFVDIDVDRASSFRTVMAYGDRCTANFGSSCTRLQYFSNPTVPVGGDWSGVPSGTASNCVEGVEPVVECDAENATALDNTAATFAAFRSTTVLARIAKEVSVGFVDIGDSIAYTLTVTNDSGTAAHDIVIKDVVPAHTTLSPGSLSADANASGVTPGSLITWTTGVSLNPGDTLQRTFSVTAADGGIASNSATVDSSSTSLTMTSNTVSTAIWEAVSCGFQDGFESGGLSHYWRVENTQEGRARATTDLPDTGSYSAVLDDRIGNSTHSEATMTIAADLAGLSTAQLDFRWAEGADENGLGDGVFVREGTGDPWVSVLSFDNSPDLIYQDGSVDLAQAAVNNGLTLTDGFQIRFQFNDNFPFNPGNLGGSDGYAIDNVSLTCDCIYELTSDTVSTPTVEQSACTIYVGPSYTVDGTGVLTLRSPQGVVLRDGFSVLTDGQVTVELGPVQ